jgi:hypothetical protein
MLRRLGFLLALGLACAATASADVQPGLTVKPVAVLAQATLVSADDLQANLAIFDAYAARVCAAWHCVPPTLYLTTRPKPGEEAITVRDGPLPGECQCAGYHTVGPIPRAHVFVATLEGFSWTEVFSHELGEMLVDANGATAVQVASPYSNGPGGYESPTVFYAQEIADPVEAHPFLIDGVPVADFVTPAWYVRGSRGPFDAARATGAPLTLLPLGYQSEFVYGRWKDITGPGVHVR